MSTAEQQQQQPGMQDTIVFLCEKKSPFTSSWTMRRCAFNCETRYLYYSSKALNLTSPWKKVLKITSVTVPAEAEDFDVKQLFVRDNHTDGDHNERNLYTFQVEGIYRNIMAHTAPPTKVAPNALAFQRKHRGWPSKHSPRGDSFQRDKTVRYTWRCDNAALLHKVVETMRDVLADDGLCPRIHEGLPPYDPRNNIPLAHIPMYLGKPFKGLERTVFYAFERGDMIGQGPTGQVGTAIAGGFLCVTDQMVLLMRPDGTVPRWTAIDRIESVEYNAKKAKLPFIAIRTASSAAPDIVFVPLPPLLTGEERRAYSGARQVERLVELLAKVSAFVGGTLQVAPEDSSPTVRSYIEAKAAGKHPLRFVPEEGYNEPLVFPLPKAELAKRTEAQRGEEQRRHLQQRQQQQRTASHSAAQLATDDSQSKTIDVGDVEMYSRKGISHHAPGGALAQAVSITPAPPRHPQEVPQRTHEEVVLPSDSSDEEDDGADPDLDIPSAQPRQPPRQQPPNNNADVDDIDLSDSLDDLLLADPAPNTRNPTTTAAAGGQAADTAATTTTTLEHLINQSFAAYPQ